MALIELRKAKKVVFMVIDLLAPTPEQYAASLWCEVNALKAAISMPAKGTMPRP